MGHLIPQVALVSPRILPPSTTLSNSKRRVEKQKACKTSKIINYHFHQCLRRLLSSKRLLRICRIKAKIPLKILQLDSNPRNNIVRKYSRNPFHTEVSMRLYLYLVDRITSLHSKLLLLLLREALSHQLIQLLILPPRIII
jgi:hypothetical protein